MAKRIIAVVLMLAFAAASGFKASAHSIPASVTRVAQDAAVCADAEFITGIGTDMTALGEKFKATDVKNVAATSQTFLEIASIRQKYEDMTVANECIDLQFETILAFSNASDILALALAAETDTANAELYNKVMPDQLTRLQNSTQNVLIVAGIATPAPDATPVGRISGITSATCEDSEFLTALGKDLEDFSTTLSSTDMESLASIAQNVLLVSALRQQYEDLKAPSGCEITQLTTIITLANATDLLGLALAVKADSANAELYAKALEAQSTRTQDLIKKIVTAAGAATPEAAQ
jgi:hypothetical protein